MGGFDLAGAARAGTSFIVVATQGKRDREALEAALRTGAPYVAFVGSRKKAADLKERLKGRGVAAERLAALRSPAGLDIGAVTPEEIALSVLAEIVQERRRASPVGLIEDEVTQGEPIEGAPIEGVSIETRVVQPAASGCCGAGEKH